MSYCSKISASNNFKRTRDIAECDCLGFNPKYGRDKKKVEQEEGGRGERRGSGKMKKRKERGGKRRKKEEGRERERRRILAGNGGDCVTANCSHLRSIKRLSKRDWNPTIPFEIQSQ